jgi:hypothetical protein
MFNFPLIKNAETFAAVDHSRCDVTCLTAIKRIQSVDASNRVTTGDRHPLHACTAHAIPGRSGAPTIAPHCQPLHADLYIPGRVMSAPARTCLAPPPTRTVARAAKRKIAKRVQEMGLPYAMAGAAGARSACNLLSLRCSNKKKRLRNGIRKWACTEDDARGLFCTIKANPRTGTYLNISPEILSPRLTRKVEQMGW